MKAVMLVMAAVATAAAAAEIVPEDRLSGYQFAAPEARAMQDEDSANPGILGVLQGESLWAAKTGARASGGTFAEAAAFGEVTATAVGATEDGQQYTFGNHLADQATTTGAQGGPDRHFTFTSGGFGQK